MDGIMLTGSVPDGGGSGNNTAALSKQIQPTVFIALGGTGNKVCTRIFDRIDSYVGGCAEYYGCLQFVFIDTSNTDIKKIPQIVSNFHTIHCVINPQTTLDMLRVRHADEWFPYNFKVGNHVLADGASQIRPYGRLAFYQYYQQICNTIDRAIQNANNIGANGDIQNSPKLRALNLANLVNVGNKLKFIVVASIAGGTGSGMLIDMLALIRNNYLRNGAELDLHILGASHFANLNGVDRDSVQANAYACLKELNYFHSNHAITPIDANWNLMGDGTCRIGQGNSGEGTGILADHIFLYENQNASGNFQQNIDDFYTSLADSIFRDYTVDSFAQQKRDVVDNMKFIAASDCQLRVTVQGYNGVSYTKGYPQRFQSQGYAALGVPHDLMIEAASCRLANEVIGCLKSPGSAETSEAEKELLNILGTELSDDALDLQSLYFDGGCISFNKDKPNDFLKALPGSNSLYTVLAALLAAQSSGSIEDMAGRISTNADCFKLLRDRQKSIPASKNDGCHETVQNAVDDAVKALSENGEIGTIMTANRMNILACISKKLDALIQSTAPSQRLHVLLRLKEVLAEQSEAVVQAIADVNTLSDKYKRVIDHDPQLSGKPYANDDYGSLWTKLRDTVTQKTLGLFSDQAKKDPIRLKLSDWCYRLKFGSDANGKDLSGELASQLLINALAALRQLCGDLTAQIDNEIGGITAAMPEKLSAWAEKSVDDKQKGLVRVLKILADLPGKLQSMYKAAASLFSGLNKQAGELTEAYRVEQQNLPNIVDYLETREKKYYSAAKTNTFVSYIIGVNQAAVGEILNTCLADRENVKLGLVNDFIDQFADGSSNSFTGKLKNLNGFIKDFNAQSHNVSLTELIDKCRLQFVQTVPDKYNFWNVFMEAYPQVDTQKNIIVNLCRFSDYWLNRNSSYVQEIGSVHLDYYSLPSSPAHASANMQTCISTITQSITTAIPTIQIITNPVNCGQIEIIRQSPNVGICYSNQLSNMAMSYKNVKNANLKPLHIHVNEAMFDDIQVLTPVVAGQEFRAIETAILGLCFDIINYDPVNDNYTFTQTLQGGTVNVCVLAQSTEQADWLQEIINNLTNNTPVQNLIYGSIDGDRMNRGVRQTIFANLPCNPVPEAPITTWECYLNLCSELPFLNRFIKEASNNKTSNPVNSIRNYLFEQCRVHIYGSAKVANNLDANRDNQIRQKIAQFPLQVWRRVFPVRPADGMLIWPEKYSSIPYVDDVIAQFGDQ